MSFYRRCFNLYLLATALGLLGAGCQTGSLGSLFHHKNKHMAALRIHLESEATAAGVNKNITIMRSQPVMLNISTEPILTEADVLGARLIDSYGSFAVEVTFEETSGWKLEQYSAANPGKHLAIFGQWSDKLADGRWLAAPLITRRLAGNVLVFTPDASREEAEKLVAGLNLIGKENAGIKAKE
jgi:preprotein translocase subunit SecD